MTAERPPGLPPDSPALQALRANAEALLAPGLPAGADTELAGALRQLHELQVHQVELQLQHDELSRTRGALAGALQRQRQLFDEAPVGYCTVDAQGVITQANAMAQRLLGHGTRPLVGHALGSCLSAEGAQTLQALLRRTAAWPALQVCEAECALGGPAAGPGAPSAEAGDGHGPTARMLQIEARAEAGGKGFLVALIDVTERRLAQAERTRAEVAEALHRSKTHFLSQMSHELRTPLNAILGFTQLLQLDPAAVPEARHREWIATIAQAGEHMLSLIGDALDIARIDAGRLALSPEPLAPGPLVEKALQIMAATADLGGVRLRAHAAGAQGVRVLADRLRLHQVLLNLLANAIRFSPAGGEVRIDVGMVPAAAGARVLLSVTDQGPGMDADQMARLFQPFERLGADPRNGSGTGLGLVISRRLSEAMDGTLTVHSRPGQGTTVQLSLPAA